MKRMTSLHIVDQQLKHGLFAKKVRKIGIDCWFGYGGGIKPGESAAESIIREVREESGERIFLTEDQLQPVALIKIFKGKANHPVMDDPACIVLFYRAIVNRQTIGVPVPTDEMANPTWFDLLYLPVHEMMPGDRLFVPQILLGVPIKGWIHLSSDEKSVYGASIMPCTREELVL